MIEPWTSDLEPNWKIPTPIPQKVKDDISQYSSIQS